MTSPGSGFSCPSRCQGERSLGGAKKMDGEQNVDTIGVLQRFCVRSPCQVEDEVRFGLTSEAGLNDGLAFPFVNLAIALALVA